MAEPKKRKVESECNTFQKRRECEYFFKEFKGKCVCLICTETVAVMKEYKYNVRCHYETKHQAYASYTGAEREQKGKQMVAVLQGQQQYFICAQKVQEKATIASYEVAQLIARHGKPFSDGDLIKQCALKKCKTSTTSACPEVQWCDALKTCQPTLHCNSLIKLVLLIFYSIALDENFGVTEELLDLKSLKGTTTDMDVFEAVSDSIDKMGLKWDKLCGVTTDGAPAMAGAHKGVASMMCSKVKETGGEAFKMHCIAHQEALCAKTVNLGDVMNKVVKTVNIIQTRGLYHREFQAFLSDVDAEYGDLLYHSDVHWLSRGAVLKRFCSLRTEIDQFLKEKDRPLHELNDPLWLADLTFLVDLTDHLTTLNKSLQGKEQTAYPQANLSAKKGKYVSVITCLETEFRQRFRDFSVIEKEIKLVTPFLVDPEEVEENLPLELIKIQCDDCLKNHHQQLSLPEFYRGLEKEKFPLMRRHVKKMISLFGSTYICEQTFSLLTLNKSRLRTKMTDSHLHNILRISTTKFTPDLPAILRSKAQQHCSP
uniref:SPIN-DOC-like zinc-finger domain-containing protein n=1 Tax=Pygocentrus nattereri TaxID=42514 RepID=A0AAR2KGQ1_PYGNA